MPITSPAAVKEYLRTNLTDLQNERLAKLFLDTLHRHLEYIEMFRSTIDSASVYPSEVVEQPLRLNAEAVILSHNLPSGIPGPVGR